MDGDLGQGDSTMRINLVLKFFIAFLATSITIVVIMIAALQFHARRSFTEYVRNVEAIRLRELGQILQQEYRVSGGWERLQNSSERWHRLLRPAGPPPLGEPSPALLPGLEMLLKAPPRRPHPPDPLRPEGDRRRTPPGDRSPPSRPPKPEGDRPPEPPPDIEHRLALFDREKQPLIGRADSAEGHTLQELVVDGQTVGWLGLRNEERPSDELGLTFLTQQARAFYLVGAIMLALAAVMAYLLARHLLAPVRQLIAGTRSLTSRRFDARISVTSSDELGKLARDFNQMAGTLEQYEQLRRQWISDIAHELRTPLAVLQGEIEALLDGIREPRPERLESLHAEVVRLIRIVQSLHDLSVAESAALSFKKEPVNIIQTLRSCIQHFSDRFSARGIAVADELGDSGAAVMVTGDADRLTQVFSNLFENSLRYTDPPGRLTISRLGTASEALLRFSDTEPGVPEEALPRIFERLYRVDVSRSRASGGSGLGLSICKTIIEAHGGSITARQAPSGGLLIEIALPLLSSAGKDAHGR